MTMGDGAPPDGCDIHCSSPVLTRRQRERCGVWHQLTRLGRSDRHLSCRGFILHEDSLCGVALDGITIGCVDGALTSLVLEPVVWDSTGRVFPGGRDAFQEGCRVTYQGTLAPELAVVDTLRHVDLNLESRLSTYPCRGFTVTGGNITGTVPPQWGVLNLSFADFRGNRDLQGSLPAQWMSHGGLYLVRGTGLHQVGPSRSCGVKCTDRVLSGYQKERCALWNQMSRMSHSPYWLPPCTAYIFTAVQTCPVLFRHTLMTSCSPDGRVHTLIIAPYVSDSNGQPVVPYQRSENNTRGQCLAQFEGTLAPELVAMDKLRYFRATVPPWFGYTGWQSNMYDCKQMLWRGMNITGSIPQVFDHLPSIQLFGVHGNRLLQGTVPKSLLRITPKAATGGLFTNTQVDLPKIRWTQRDVLCKSSQRRQGTMALATNTEYLYFGVKMTWGNYSRQQYDRFTVSSVSSPSWYCGKQDAAPQVGAVWGVFGVLLIILTTWRRWEWRRVQLKRPTLQEAKSEPPATKENILEVMVRKMRTLAAMWPLYHAPFFAIVTLYDLASDLFLAWSMFPSWTTGFVLVGALLPNLFCSVVITLTRVRDLKQKRPAWTVLLLLPVIFFVTLLIFPAMVIGLTLLKLSQGKISMGDQFLLWSKLDVDRLALLFSGLTACTEDLFVTVFTSVSYVMMARAPWTMTATNVYFAAWAFWMSMLTSMFHMLLCWWDAVGYTLEYGSLAWVKEAFVLVSGPREEDRAESDVELEGMLLRQRCVKNNEVLIGVIQGGSCQEGGETHKEDVQMTRKLNGASALHAKNQGPGTLDGSYLSVLTDME